MFHRISLVLAPALLIALAGCPSLSTMQTPSTVPKGETRIGVGLEAIGLSQTTTDGSGNEVTTSASIPQFEVNARYGLTDEIDVGAKVYFLGVEIGAKYQFLKGQFDAAVAPAVSYISITSGSGDTESKVSVAYFHIPILFGYNVSDSLTLAFGPKFLYSLATGTASSGGDSSSATAGGLMAGGFASVPYRVGKAFWIAPEINVYKPFADSSGIIWQGGLVLLFGGGPQAAPPMGAAPQ